MRFLILPVLLVFSAFTYAGNLKLWYNKPASEWTEALPLGNSRLGAMVYGGTETEKTQHNEGTFWGGSPYRDDNTDALQRGREAR